MQKFVAKYKPVLNIILTTVITLLLIAAILLIYISNIPRISIIKPVTKEISEDISVTGTVVEKSRKSISLDFPVVIKNVYYELGDNVEFGDVLASTDILATKSTLIEYVSSFSSIPDSYVSLIKNIEVDIDKLANLIPDKITANCSGTITELNMESGGTTDLGETLVTVSDLSRLYCKFSISEEQVSSVNIGDEVVFSSIALNNKQFRGKVASVAPTAKEQLIGMSKQTVVDIFVYTGKSDVLKPGFSVTGSIKKPLEGSSLVIPYECISQDIDNKEFVYIYNDSTAIKRYVTTGKEFDTVVEITGGLDKDTKVILNADKVKKNYGLVTVK